jgi:hypothetical protein
MSADLPHAVSSGTPPRPRTLDECRADLVFMRDTLIANIKAAVLGPERRGMATNDPVALPCHHCRG